jgi:acylphosphatase
VIRRRVVVSGRVQGVFFRDSCRELATRRGVSGWVANRDDGTVEAVFEGDSAAVDALVDWCRSGPPSARVDWVEVSDEEPQNDRSFRVV